LHQRNLQQPHHRQFSESKSWGESPIFTP